MLNGNIGTLYIFYNIRTKFVNGEDEVKSLPPEAQDMFTLLTEDEFRLDISSTELRKQIVYSDQ